MLAGCRAPSLGWLGWPWLAWRGPAQAGLAWAGPLAGAGRGGGGNRFLPVVIVLPKMEDKTAQEYGTFDLLLYNTLC